jgi:hypothetical protein
VLKLARFKAFPEIIKKALIGTVTKNSESDIFV